MRLRSGLQTTTSTSQKYAVRKQVQPSSASSSIGTESSARLSKRAADVFDSTPRQVDRKRAKLTAKNLKRHTAAGRIIPGQAAMSGKRSATSESASSQSSKKSKTSKNTTTTDSMFAEKLRRKNVKEFLEAEPPLDVDTVRAYVNRNRDLPEPSRDDFVEYRNMLKDVIGEPAIHNLIFMLLVTYKRKLKDYGPYFSVPWTKVDNALTSGCSPARPDMCESYRSGAYPESVLDALGSALQPSKHPLTLPRVCVEFKGPDGDLATARSQCAYDGAIMVNAAKKIHQYLGMPESTFFDTTQALTIAFDGVGLEVFTNHAIDETRTEYHHFALYMDRPALSYGDFKETYRHVNNVLDWARERATETLNHLLEHDQAIQNASVRGRALQRAQDRDVDDARQQLTPSETQVGDSAVSPPIARSSETTSEAPTFISKAQSCAREKSGRANSARLHAKS